MDASEAEPWMALPLFNRAASPDRHRVVAKWYECWPPSDSEDEDDEEMGDYHTSNAQDDTSSPSHISSRPQSEPFEFDFHARANADGFVAPDNSRKGTSSPSQVSSSRPQSELFDSDYHVAGSSSSQAAATSAAASVADGFLPDQDHVVRSGLVCEISDEHIPQQPFTPQCLCPFPGCRSAARFSTGRDFRRHYRHHFKRFFCRYPECQQAVRDLGEVGDKGFSTRKDRARHESKHNPSVQCHFRDQSGNRCSKTFSRKDNMKDHYKRMHGD